MKYTVEFKIEVDAATPRQAAIVARDMMLDVDTRLHVDIYPHEFIEEAQDWFPIEDHGWYASFEKSVHPDIFFSWEKHEL